jgi:NaMN:DMB phosphoribosyltransferase
MSGLDINSYWSDFDFQNSNQEALKLYDSGEAKEGVGAGGALIYGLLNGISKQQIIDKIEKFLG